jgi:hypothetical protein
VQLVRRARERRADRAGKAGDHVGGVEAVAQLRHGRATAPRHADVASGRGAQAFELLEAATISGAARSAASANARAAVRSSTGVSAAATAGKDAAMSMESVTRRSMGRSSTVRGPD